MDEDPIDPESLVVEAETDEPAVPPILWSSMRSGAHWFYWIAALSVINSLLIFVGSSFGFLLGLGVTEFIATIIDSAKLNPLSGVVTFVGIGAELFIAGMFAAFGYYASQGKTWAFMTGLTIYGLDALFSLYFGMTMSAILHLLALWFIYSGFTAQQKLLRYGVL
jgi:hypothetical protein